MNKKLRLLSVVLLIGGSTFAQINGSDAPAIGYSQSMFVLDSSATDYAIETGASAVWDYSTITGYNGLKSHIHVDAADQTNYDTSFTSSDRAFTVDDYFMTYFKNPSATNKLEQGFVFVNSDTNVPVLDIVVPFDADAEVLQYPMNLGDEVNTTFQGNAWVTIVVNPTNPYIINPFMKGTSSIKLDGKGTLKYGETTYTNVYRYRIEDHASTYVTEMSDSAFYNRVQYEYYDFSVSKLPIFLHASAQFLLGTTPMIDVHPVLGFDQVESVGIEENTPINMAVYPNPANRSVNVQLASSIDNGKVSVIDNLGRTVRYVTMNGNSKTLNVASLKRGIYFIRISNGNQSTTKKLVIQ